MQLGAEAIITNEYNQALFILRNDTRTWAMPGGRIEREELPDEAAAREAQEESGLKVLPVRLVGLYYRRQRPWQEQFSDRDSEQTTLTALLPLERVARAAHDD